jgi:outer membrane protein assembly factor BamB
MFSSPAFYAGNLFITDTSYPVSSNQGHLFCQNASTGVLKWTQPIGENWYSSPTVYDGDIYACGGGYLRCFDMAGDLLWASNPAVATVGASASPTIGDGRVYVGDAHDGVDAFSVDDGTFLWHHIFNFTVFGSHQAIFIGCPILFVQSPAPSLGWQSMIYVTNCGGYEWALNAITGEQVWNQTLSATNNQPYLIYGSQAFAFGKESLGLGNIFVSSEYHKVIYELDNMTGEIIREIHTSVVSYGGFAISNTTGLIYIAGIGGVQAFHILDGSLVWSRLWSTGEPDLGIMSSPAIAEFNGVGWLYVGMPDGKLYSFATIIPPDTCIVNVLSSPFIVGSVGFTINGGVSLSTPYSASLNGTYTFARSQATVTVNSSMIYGFCQWVVENGSGTFRFSGSSVTLGIITGTNYVILNYTAVRIVLSSSPECHATFGSDLGYSYNTPQVLYYPNGTHTFTVPATIPINASYKDGFSHWIVNNSRSYTTLSLSLNFQDPTVLTVFYTLIYAPWIPPQTYGALNATWYMRSDTQTVHGVLGFKLLTVNTHTPTWDSLIYSYNGTVSYGVRVWAFDLFGNEFELTSGVPAAVVTITNGSIGLFNAIWICPAYNSMIDAIMVDVYQRFGSGSWTLRRIFVTDSDLLIWLPQAAWTFHYWLSWKDGVGNSTFAHGSYNIFDSRVDLSYIPADPWDVALARLQQQNFIGFLFTPWTYWFGDLFWTILLFGCIVMGWLRTGSLKPILGLLWLLGGSGSILWALIPPVALHVAVLMLALAMAITLFRLIYGR